MATIGAALTSPESGWTRYEDSNAMFTYSNGTWTLNSANASRSGGAESYSNTLGAKVSFTFNGTDLRIMTETHATHSGAVSVTIDGVNLGSFSEQINPGNYQILVYETSGLSNGSHSVVLENLESNYLVFDAIDVRTVIDTAVIGQPLSSPSTGWKRYDDKDSKIAYDGSNHADSAGAPSGYNATLTYSRLSTKTLFKFVGTKIRIIGRYEPNADDNIQISIDGVTEVFSQRFSTDTFKVLCYEKTGLTFGIHDIKIWTDALPPRAFYFDAVDINDTGYLVHPFLTQKSSIADMEIGDFIPCRYKAATSGAIGNFSELGTCVASEIPVVGSATPDGLFNFIKVDKGLLIADRVVQHSISWDTLNASELAQGVSSSYSPTDYVDSDAFASVVYNNNTIYTKNSKNNLTVRWNGTASSELAHQFTSASGFIMCKFKISRLDDGIVISPRMLYASTKLWEGLQVYNNKLVLHHNGQVLYTGSTIGKEIVFMIDLLNKRIGVSLDGKLIYASNNYTPGNDTWVVSSRLDFIVNTTSTSDRTVILNYFYISTTNKNYFPKDFDGMIRSLSGGCSYVDYYKKRVVSALLHMDGSDGATNIVDSFPASNKIITVKGNAKISTLKSKFGGSSVYFPGAVGDYITIKDHPDFELFDQDFTIDMWINPDQLPASGSAYVLYTKRASSLTYSSMTVFLDPTGYIGCHTTSNGTSWDIAMNLVLITGIVPGIWQRITIVRKGNTIYGFKTGVLSNSNPFTGRILGNSSDVVIGGDTDKFNFKGYIDEVRVIKGSGDYIENFTPESVPFEENNNMFVGPFLSLADKGYGAFPINNEWDTYIQNSTLGGKISRGDDNIWHKLATQSMTMDVIAIGSYLSSFSVAGTGLSTGRVKRGNDTGLVSTEPSWKNFSFSGSDKIYTTMGFRPVLEYIEPNSKQSNFWY